MAADTSSAVNTARQYYDSDDADTFYATIWGGEDIHVGIYHGADEPIATASRRTVEHMAATVPDLGPDTRVLDIGAGYGGAARYLASTFGCRVVALNLSAVENERNRRMNREQGLDGLIEVVDASFESIPADADAFDLVWSQDAILHSGAREQVIGEVARVLARGGHFVFTDPMQADDCPAGVLQPILDRIHLQSLGSPALYRRAAAAAGLQEVGFEELTPQLAEHYGRVLAETERREMELRRSVDAGYIERMKKGLRHWIEGGRRGHLAWGIFHFRKP